jgi:hypothetical protein
MELIDFLRNKRNSSLIKILQSLTGHHKKIMILNRAIHSFKLVSSYKPIPSLNFPSKSFSSVSTIKEKITKFTNQQSHSDEQGNRSSSSKSWVKYAIGIPLISGFALYQYTKYKFLQYKVP